MTAAPGIAQFVSAQVLIKADDRSLLILQELFHRVVDERFTQASHLLRFDY